MYSTCDSQGGYRPTIPVMKGLHRTNRELTFYIEQGTTEYVAAGEQRPAPQRHVDSSGNFNIFLSRAVVLLRSHSYSGSGAIAARWIAVAPQFKATVSEAHGSNDDTRRKLLRTGLSRRVCLFSCVVRIRDVT